DGFIIINAKRRIVDANAAAARLLKRDPASLRGLAIDTVAPDVPPLGATGHGELGPDKLGDGTTYVVSFNTLTSPRGEALGAVIQIRDVTEERRREAELREANDRKEAVIAATPDHLFRVRDDGTVLGYVPPSGFAPDDVYLPTVGTNMRDRIPPSQIEPILMAMARARRTGAVQVIELPTTRPSGGDAILETRVSPMPGEECLLFVRDVTETRRREHAVREAQNKTQAIIAALPDYVVSIKDDGTVLSTFAPSGGVERDIHLLPVVGDNIFRNSPRVHRDDFERAVRDARASGQVQVFEIQLTRPSGAIAHVEIRVSPMADDECLLLIRDMTAKRQQEHALLVATERTKAILAAVPDHIFLITEDGVVLEHYPPVGYTGASALMTPVGQSYHAHLPPAWSAALDQTIRAARTTGELQSLEMTAPRQDGGLLYLEVRIVPMSGNEMLLFARNVTDKRLREQELQEAKDKTQAIIRAMPDHIFQVRADGVVLAHYPPADAAATDTFITPVGENFVNHLPADWCEQFFNAMRAAHATGKM
ncbi:MAG: PAS domain-containing protein, partial [Dehalococcoidia bacterium]|nr:PAS domain-containing protein [Dehalococcoidia bacterium]